MSLEIRKSSSRWYGTFVVNGKKTIVNLGVPINGERPRNRTMVGDDEFATSLAITLASGALQRRFTFGTGRCQRRRLSLCSCRCNRPWIGLIFPTIPWLAQIDPFLRRS